MKKRQVANLIMVAIIVVIAAAGILWAGHILGWFDKLDKGEGALLTDRSGIITLSRDGVAFTVTEDTVLRSGDRIVMGNGAKARISLGESYLILGDRAELTLTDATSGSFHVTVDKGEIFCHSKGKMALTVEKEPLTLEETTVLVSVRTGTQSISVLSGKVLDAQAGQILEWINGEKNLSPLSIQSLNSFAISCIRGAGEDAALCYTAKDLDKLEADRIEQERKELEALLNPTTAPTTAVDPTEATTEATNPPETTPSQGGNPTETDPPMPTGPKPTTPPATKPTETNPPATNPQETKPPATTAPKPTEPPATEPNPPKTYTCTITIRCDTILNNMEDLNPEKVGFVPEDGIILYPVQVRFTEGETVFDVLKRACDAAGIQLEYSWTPMYSSYYVEGINYLYEFDCGEQSGWMYKVNGWFPNYGCSSYYLKDGDNIVWTYTCQGLGTDVGAPAW